VTGAVGSPSSIPFRNGMTVLDVVLDAGGVTDFSNPGKTVIYRKDGVRLPVRLDRILKRGDLSTNYTLMPGDVISVPESLF
jgi:polysaccharide export outer membrane protein